MSEKDEKDTDIKVNVVNPVDERTPDQKAPKRASAASADAPSEAASKSPKAPKAPKEPRVPWEPSTRAKEIMDAIFEYAETGDKKLMAYFAREALRARDRAKEVRERAEEIGG